MLAVLSDIHGNLPALEAVVEDAQANGATGFLNLGDILSGPLWPRETAEWLMARDWPTIAGNHERQVLTGTPGRMGTSDAFASAQLADNHRAWLAGLPTRLELDNGLLACHGSPASDLEHLLFDHVDGTLRPAAADEVARRIGPCGQRLILCGHSHVPSVLDLPDGRQAANPGSVGLQAYDDDHPAPYRVEVGDPKARYALVDAKGVHLRAVAYDHASAAAQAERNGQPGWAMALANGRMS